MSIGRENQPASAPSSTLAQPPTAKASATAANAITMPASDLHHDALSTAGIALSRQPPIAAHDTRFCVMIMTLFNTLRAVLPSRPPGLPAAPEST